MNIYIYLMPFRFLFEIQEDFENLRILVEIAKIKMLVSSPEILLENKSNYTGSIVQMTIT